MELTQDTRCDFRNNDAKHRQRVKNLEQAKQSSNLWSQHHQALRLDWLELAGEGAPTCRYLDNTGALQRGARFIGVDTEAGIVGRCRDQYGTSSALWHASDLLSLVRGSHPDLDRVGVLNYDSFDAPGAPLSRAVRILDCFAQRQLERFGSFLLILNVTCKHAQTAENAAEEFLGILRGCVLELSTWPEPWSCRYRSKTKSMFNVPVRYGY